MVSTRNAIPTASLARSKTGRGGRKPGGQSTASPSAIEPLPKSFPTNVTQADGSRVRKRARNEFHGNHEAPPSASLSAGEQNPGSKRARSQVPPAEIPRRTRRAAQPAAQHVATAAVQGSVLGSEQLGFYPSALNVTDYEKTGNGQYGQQAFAALSTGDSNPISLQGLQLRNQSLPVLDNFATQILSVSATTPYQEIFNMATNPQTHPGQQWSQLITLFSETKKVYASHDPFLSPQKLGYVEKAQVDIIKKANMATFVCGLFGCREDVGFSHLNEFFLETFVIESATMLRSQINLFLDLKTQAYISAVTSDKAALTNGHGRREQILDALFPSQLDEHLIRRSGAALLTPTESDFVHCAQNRRKALLEQSDTEAAISALPKKYPWEGFLKDVHSYVASNFDDLTGIIDPKILPARRSPNRARAERKMQGQATSQPTQDNDGQQPQDFIDLQRTRPQAESSASEDVAEKAARAAHFALENYSAIAQQFPVVQPTPQSSQNIQTSSQPQHQLAQAAGPPIQFHFERPLHPNVPSPPAPFFSQIPYQNGQMQGHWHPSSGGDGQSHQSYHTQGMVPYPTQSAPTHVLYERARQAATTKPSQQQPPRKTATNTPPQRRPWTAEEENALMAGLDRVKGPHWSQIHAMFGPGGTINEVLKNRSQVQLKDKARNLKLFFLKSNIEVPYYLQFVTGELKTRAPSRLAKNEAREKAMSEEDRAHVQGIMTLAGTANALQEEDHSNLVLQDTQGECDPNGLDLSASSGHDVNIDPSLETQLRNAGNADAHFPNPYTVPTPNMVMQSLDRFSGVPDTGQQLQR